MCYNYILYTLIYRVVRDILTSLCRISRNNDIHAHAVTRLARSFYNARANWTLPSNTYIYTYLSRLKVKSLYNNRYTKRAKEREHSRLATSLLECKRSFGDSDCKRALHRHTYIHTLSLCAVAPTKRNERMLASAPVTHAKCTKTRTYYYI